MQYNEEKEIVYTEEEAADYIAMSRSFLRQDRMNGYRDTRTLGPHFVKNGRAIRYLKRDLDEWLFKNRVVRVKPDYHCN